MATIFVFITLLSGASSFFVALRLLCRTKLQIGSTAARQGINSDSDVRRARVESNSGFTEVS